MQPNETTLIGAFATLNIAIVIYILIQFTRPSNKTGEAVLVLLFSSILLDQAFLVIAAFLSVQVLWLKVAQGFFTTIALAIVAAILYRRNLAIAVDQLQVDNGETTS